MGGGGGGTQTSAVINRRQMLLTVIIFLQHSTNIRSCVRVDMAVLGSLATPNSHCGLCGHKAMLPLNCSQRIFMVRSASRMTEIESETRDCVGDSAN